MENKKKTGGSAEPSPEAQSQTEGDQTAAVMFTGREVMFVDGDQMKNVTPKLLKVHRINWDYY